MTPSVAPRADADAARGLTETAALPRAAAVPEGYLTMSGLRERGWTDAMIRDYLGDPDATRPNPRYWSAAPMKLYLADRAGAAEATAEWTERKALGDRRRAAGEAVSARKRAETEALARQLAADVVARLVFPADPRQAAIDAYNNWHSTACTCPGWHELGFCERRAAVSDPPDFLRRSTINYARHELTGYDRAHQQLARRVGQRDAHELLRAAVNAAIKAKLDVGRRRDSHYEDQSNKCQQPPGELCRIHPDRSAGPIALNHLATLRCHFPRAAFVGLSARLTWPGALGRARR